MSLNKEQLAEWVGQSTPSLSSSAVVLSPLAGDAGFRQYFAVNSEPPLLAVMAPRTEGVSESASYFAQLADLLRQYGVATPQIMALDQENNYLLIEHFGDVSLHSALSPDNVDELYTAALNDLLALQSVPRSAVDVASYDRQLLLQEMNVFREWFVEQLLGYSLSADEQDQLDLLFDFLVEQALEQPQVLVHRDYHSRNLMCRKEGGLGVIDFQDAVWGPVTYDVVSLLRDCYIRWQPEHVKQWVLSYSAMAHQQEMLSGVSDEQLIRWFDTMGLQRHIKVLGVFARLSLRDNKHGYLKDLPLVIRYVLEVARQYPQSQAFADWFMESLLPIVQQHDWYSDFSVAGDHL